MGKNLNKRLIRSGTLVSCLFALYGCSASETDKITTPTEKSVMKKEIEKNDVTAKEVMESFDVKRTEGFAVQEPLQKIKKVSEFKVDIERLNGRLILYKGVQPSESKNTKNEFFTSKILDSEIMSEMKKLKTLREKLDFPLVSSKRQASESVKDFYQSKEKVFVELNNALVDFDDKYLQDESVAYERRVALRVISDNYWASLLDTRIKLYQNKQYSQVDDTKKSTEKGMTKSEQENLSNYAQAYATLAEDMEKAVMSGW